MLLKLGGVVLGVILESLACETPDDTPDGAPDASLDAPPAILPAHHEISPGKALPVAIPPVSPGLAPPADMRPQPGVLTPTQRTALADVPEERIFGSPIEHFTVSNEYRHDLWFPFVRGLGGAYVGVASDQNYTLIAAARSEVAYLIDLDRQVVDLHGIYAALIAAAPDPAAFMAFFADKASARRESRQVLLDALSGHSSSDRTRVLAFFDAQRGALAEYLQKVQSSQKGSWLADPDAYTYIRAMFAMGRIRVLQGNLTGRQTMAGIAASARALGVPINILYLSNAEEYLFYTERFSNNVRALPLAPESVLLRTIHDRFEGWESCGDGDTRWNYQVQLLDDFAQRLGARGRGRNQDRTTMLVGATREGAVQRRARGVSVIAPSKPDIGREITSVGRTH